MRQSLLLSATVAALAGVCLLPSVAAAQPSVTAPLAPLPGPPRAVDTSDDFNPTTAFALSLGATVAGYVSLAAADNAGDSAGPALAIVGVGAVALGPSFGHFYQGDIWTRGLGVRLAGSAAMIVGLSTIDWVCFENCDHSDDSFGEMMMIGGLAAFAIGSADDIISAPFAARHRNALRHQRLLNLTVVPRVSGKDAGLVVAGRF
jgi:hypothetical protein